MVNKSYTWKLTWAKWSWQCRYSCQVLKYQVVQDLIVELSDLYTIQYFRTWHSICVTRRLVNILMLLANLWKFIKTRRIYHKTRNRKMLMYHNSDIKDKNRDCNKNQHPLSLFSRSKDVLSVYIVNPGTEDNYICKKVLTSVFMKE